MPTAEKNKAALVGLISKANAATGESSATLSDAVDTLIAGFGQGGGGITLDDFVSGAEPSGDVVVGAITPRQGALSRCTNITSLTCEGTVFSSAHTASFQYLGNCKAMTFVNTSGTLPALMFAYASSCRVAKIIGTFPQTIPSNAFNGFGSAVGTGDIYVPWAEGAVANAPWGATKATIHYDTVYDADGNPIE